MQKMTPRQLEIAREISKTFDNINPYQPYPTSKTQRLIAEFYTDGFVNAQDEWGDTLLHYMCEAWELPKEFANAIANLLTTAFKYAPDPMIKNRQGKTPEDLLQAYYSCVSPGGSCHKTVKHYLKTYKKDYENNRLRHVEKELRDTQYALFHLLQGLQALTNEEGPEPTKVANNHWHNAIHSLKSRERE